MNTKAYSRRGRHALRRAQRKAVAAAVRRGKVWANQDGVRDLPRLDTHPSLRALFRALDQEALAWAQSWRFV